MDSEQPSPTRTRPMRELIRPDLEPPLQPLSEHNERRHYHRYDGHQLPGTLSRAGLLVPVVCVDIGYGGMQLRTPIPIALQRDDRVTVRFHKLHCAFEGSYSVRRTAPRDGGTTIHLAN